VLEDSERNLTSSHRRLQLIWRLWNPRLKKRTQWLVIPAVHSEFNVDVNYRRRLQSASTAALIVPRLTQSTIGDRALFIAAAKLWNTLPVDVTSAPSLPSFKRRLKTELLSAAIHPSVSNNYRVMVLPFTVLSRDLEAFLYYVMIVAFRFYFLTCVFTYFKKWLCNPKTLMFSSFSYATLSICE